MVLGHRPFLDFRTSLLKVVLLVTLPALDTGPKGRISNLREEPALCGVRGAGGGVLAGEAARGCRRLSACPCALEGVYGDVQRVKILFNKKENALVQMADGSQAQLGEAAGRAALGRGFSGRCPGHLQSHSSHPCTPPQP